jgi:hypothetical protein
MQCIGESACEFVEQPDGLDPDSCSQLAGSPEIVF